MRTLVLFYSLAAHISAVPFRCSLLPHPHPLANSIWATFIHAVLQRVAAFSFACVCVCACIHLWNGVCDHILTRRVFFFGEWKCNLCKFLYFPFFSRETVMDTFIEQREKKINGEQCKNFTTRTNRLGPRNALAFPSWMSSLTPPTEHPCKLLPDNNLNHSPVNPLPLS
ncbi:hypothetical protein, unlikely [Trypanosoma brucei gambiense DAL972]|uniref:T. brucei spp.-specific protein n=1 Tax=Trypanosoma brucei gambiense (strain MHOM/CI/86/DAL972) TaxID=679716 RepID=C9ZQ82_TRYB9|nr:hypothetical protein, unlikely [Trypanosoma brucei gambiense DAL972]CBH11562.1 hypothetical protein, unlikely [Trypanosoma brucei gambiense DAL972]|eukprot:XP_011773847.1 hypothetical protein, unlikely [Trypanosoma brucei gambiense DAL972]